MSAFPVILDVAIGMVFIFLSLSAIASTLNEIVARRMNMRGVFLAQGIIYLFCQEEKSISGFLGWVRQFFRPREDFVGSQSELAGFVLNHPLLLRLGTDTKKFPRYIPSNDFALATIEGIIARDPLRQVTLIQQELLRQLGPLVGPSEQPAPGPVQPVLDRAEALHRRVVEAIMQANKPEAQEVARNLARTAGDELRLAAGTILDDQKRAAVLAALDSVDLAVLRRQIEQLPNKDLRRVLTTLLSGIDTRLHNIQDATDRIETWFNNGMDRVSVLYKRQAQFILLIVGVLVCFSLNADAVRLFGTLWHDPTLRAVLVSEAQLAAPPSSLGPATGTVQDFQAEKERVNALLSQVGGLPIGWSCEDYNQIVREGFTTTQQSGVKQPPVSGPLCSYNAIRAADGTYTVTTIQGGEFGVRNSILKLIGLLAMSIAVSFGAPFWFDILNKLLSLRPDKQK